MKKITVILLALALLLTMAACGGSDGSIRDAVKDFKTAQNEAVDAVPELPPVEEPPAEEEETFGGLQSYMIDDFYGDSIYNVSFTIPENMWVSDFKNHTLYIYNVESLDEAHSAAPRIQFEIKSADSVDSYMGEASELEELENRTIGGIDMQGRYYKLWGMHWTEYYGELPDGYWMTVRISKASIDPGSDGSNILDSVVFE